MRFKVVDTSTISYPSVSPASVSPASVRPAALLLAAVLIGALLMVTAFCVPASAIVTSDTAGSHTLVDGVPLDLSGVPFLDPSLPAINHDGVGRLIFDHRRDGDDTWCSAALIDIAPPGPGDPPVELAALLAAHCITNGLGQIFDPKTGSRIADDFEVTVRTASGALRTLRNISGSGARKHVGFDGQAYHGYDLAIVPLQGVTAGVKYYSVAADDLSPFGTVVVKFGYGTTGYAGESCIRTIDEVKRWGLNEYESFGLGQFGVDVATGGFWKYTETQLTMDFDDGSIIDHNVFNFYGNFVDPPGYEICNTYESCGFGANEVLGANGDSGGPNFIFDPNRGEWVIVGVNSYIFPVWPEDFANTNGNADFDCLCNSSWGEYEGDALVTETLLQEVVDQTPPPEERRAPSGGSSPVGGGVAGLFGGPGTQPPVGGDGCSRTCDICDDSPVTSRDRGALGPVPGATPTTSPN